MADEELKKLIKEQKIKPSELFDRDELRSDPVVKKEIDLAVSFEEHWKDLQLNEEMEKEIEKEERKQNEQEELRKKKEQEENELIPDIEGDEKKEKDDNELIPGPEDDEEGEGSKDNGNELIPD